MGCPTKQQKAAKDKHNKLIAYARSKWHHSNKYTSDDWDANPSNEILERVSTDTCFEGTEAVSQPH